VNEAATAVRWLLQQGEPEARRVAVRQIAKVEGREAPELLLCALGDDDWRVRKEATLVAPSLDHRDEVVATLVAALEDTVNIGLRNAAVEALVAIGPDAVTATVDALGRLDADARKLAAEVLAGVPDSRGTAALVRALQDEDANVRAAAAEALGKAGLAGEESRAMATDALVQLLATSDVFLKIAVLDSLARLESRLPWSLFAPYVDDPLLRRYAIAAAAGSREPPAVRALALAVGDSSPTIARDALVSLGDIVASGADDPDLLECTRTALASTEAGQAFARRAANDGEDTRVRGGGLLVLGLLGAPGDVAALVNVLGDDDVAERSYLALRLFGPSAVGPLLAAARKAKPEVHAAALGLVASLEGAPVAEVRKALRAGLRHPAFEVVSCSVESLGPLGDARDLGRVAKLVWHEDERVAAAATNAVCELAARHVDAARALLRDARSGHDPLVLGCILLGAIASTQPLRADDISLLQRALSHDQPQVRRAAIDALALAGGDAAADAVVFALADEEHDVQLAAARALGRLGRADTLVGVVRDTRDAALTSTALRALGDADPDRALASARPLVAHADAAVACAAVEALAQLRSARASGRVSVQVAVGAEDALFAALDHPDEEVVKLSLSLVGAQPGARALARLGLCLDHASSEVRCVAAELLGQDNSSGARALLRARYEREKDQIVRAAITTAASIRPLAESNVPRSEWGEAFSAKGSSGEGA
jgi:HEAT repeat protein